MSSSKSPLKTESHDPHDSEAQSTSSTASDLPRIDFN